MSAIEFNADPAIINDTDYVPNAYERSGLKFARIPLDPFLKERGLSLPPVLDLPCFKPCFVAGGYVASLVSQQRLASDIDIFLPSEEALGHCAQALAHNGWEPDSVAAEVISAYSKWVTPGPKLDGTPFLQFNHHEQWGLPVQLVKIQYFTDLEHVLDCFDFTCVQFGLDLATRELVFNPVGIFDLASRNLVQHRVENTRARVLKRVEKYEKKGFSARLPLRFPEK